MRWLRSLFGLCEHNWGQWEVTEELNSSNFGGMKKVVQKRQCMRCGYTEFNIEVRY